MKVHIFLNLTILFFVFLFSFGFTENLNGQVLVADINQENKGSNPERFSSNGEELVFLAEGDEGNAIFILEGSDDAPYELLNLNDYGYGNYVLSSGLIDSLYFFVTKSDGDSYIHVININSNEVNIVQEQFGLSDSRLFTKVGDDIYFVSRHASNNTSIYKYDYPSMSASPIFEIQKQGTITKMIEYDEKLIFVRRHYEFSDDYNSIWSLDLESTIAEKLSPGNESTSFIDYGATNVFNFKNQLFFVNFETETGYEIWHSDGTVEGTKIFQDFDPGTNWGVTGIRVYDDFIYFLGINNGAYSNVYRTDGTVAGIEQVTGIQEDLDIIRIVNFMVDEEQIYLIIEDDKNGRELWISKGIEENPTLLKDINPGSADALSFSTLWRLQDGKLFFIPESEEFGDELWVSDGTQSGTRIARDLYVGKEGSGISEIASHNNDLFFGGESVEFGSELWKYSDDQEDIVLVADINTNTSGSSYPADFAILNDKLFCSAYVNCIGRELFSTDGSAKNTKLLNDIAQGRESNYFFHYEEYNGKFYFVAMDENGHPSYWSTDGSTEGTEYAFDPPVNFGPDFQLISILGSMNGKLYSLASVGGLGWALFKSDGTDAGTELVKVIAENSGVSSQFRFYTINDEVMIFETSDDIGNSVWRSDGTEEGTYALQHSIVTKMKIINEEVYFLKYNSDGNRVLWKTDGTQNGTFRVSPDISSSDISFYVEHNGFIYAVLRSADNAVLLRINETNNETIEIASHSFRDLRHLVIHNDKILTLGIRVFFNELWSYDVVDHDWERIEINNDISPLSTLNGVEYEDRYYFAANDGEHGVELWSTDGTSANTEMVADLWEGTEGSHPGPFTVFNDFIYFGADANDGSGVELYKYSPNDNDNDGYLPGIDIDDNDPNVNVDDPNDPDDVVIFCSPEDPNSIIEHNTLNGFVTIFPNPTIDLIKIDLNSLDSYQIQIFSSEGQLIMKNENAQGQVEFDLSNLSKGMYKIIIHSSNGLKNGSWTVIIQ